MQALFVLAPLAAFFIAFKLAGIYAATATLMAAMAVVLGVDYVRERRIPPLHALSALLIFVFGAATLLLHDERFIKWKPTVLLWSLSIAFLASTWLGDRPLVQRLLDTALTDNRTLSRRRWMNVNLTWVVFYALLGAANLIVAFKASTSAWVNFKFFGMPLATFAFMALQLAWIMKRSEPASASPSTQG